jgi:hypothetical protein
LPDPHDGLIIFVPSLVVPLKGLVIVERSVASGQGVGVVVGDSVVVSLVVVVVSWAVVVGDSVVVSSAVVVVVVVGQGCRQPCGSSEEAICF